MGYQQEKRFQGRLVPNKNQLLTKALPDLPYRERVEMPNEAKGPGR